MFLGAEIACTIIQVYGSQEIGFVPILDETSNIGNIEYSFSVTSIRIRINDPIVRPETPILDGDGCGARDLYSPKHQFITKSSLSETYTPNRNQKKYIVQNPRVRYIYERNEALLHS